MDTKIKKIKKCGICALPQFDTMKKNGKLKKYVNTTDKYLNNLECLLNNKSLFYEESKVEFNTNNDNSLIYIHKNTKHDKEITEVLLELEKQKFNILFYKKETGNMSFYKNIYIYNKKNINKIVEYIYIKRFICSSNSHDIIIKMAEEYKISKIRYPHIVDNNVFVQLFFSYYVKSLIVEIKEKYDIDLILDFSNFNELYIFLKRKGYVTKYYNEIIYKIKDYIKVIDKILKKDKNKIDILKKKIVKEEKRYKFNIMN